MSHLEIGALLAIISAGLLAVLFAMKEHREEHDRRFAIYLTAISTWAFCWLKMISSADSVTSLNWARALHVPGIFIPATFLHFALTFLHFSPTKSGERVLRGMYAVGVLFVPLIFYPGFIGSVSSARDFAFYLRPGPVYSLFVAYFLGSVLITFAILFREYRVAKGHRRKSIAFILAAYAIGYAGGSGVFLPHFGLPMPRFSLYGIVLCQGMILFAITKHRLMSVSLMARRTAVVAVIYLGIILGITPFVLTLHQLASDGESGVLLLEVLVLSCALSAGPYIYVAVLKRTWWLQGHQSRGLAHELRAPLNIIQSSVELLRANSGQSKNPDIAEKYLRVIDENTSRLEALTSQLLQTAKIQNGTVRLSRKPLDIAKMALAISEGFRPVAETRGVSVTVFTSGFRTVLGDEEKIYQVISNILGNALKFTTSGEISIRTEGNADEVTVTVKDTGSGISNEELPFVFDRFYQGKNASRGSGLGLSISKGWIDAHGGRIWVESPGIGKGTTIQFTLPSGRIT